MEQFDWTRFTRRIAVKATLAEVYTAWTTSAGIERWFLKTAAFADAGHHVLPDERPVTKGCGYTWNWYLYSDEKDTGRGTVTEANGFDFLQFTFAGDCLVDVQLSEEAGYTIVELTQKNIPTDDHSKQYIRLGCHSGWSFYLVNLKSVLEGGLDLRNKDSNLPPMLNN